MKKHFVLVVVFSMLCFSMTGAGFSIINNKIEESEKTIISETSLNTFNKVKETVSKFEILSNDEFKPYNELNEKQISIPWVQQGVGDLLEWYVRVVYNGKEFFQKVDVSIYDFQERFLKHPEHAKILRFNLDDDPHDDLEVLIGFYWSIIQEPGGRQQKSLELRIRVRQLYSDAGYGIADGNGELEVWSELHVNWGLIKENSRGKNIDTSHSRMFGILERFVNILNNRNHRILNVFENLFKKLQEEYKKPLFEIESEPVSSPSDTDYFSIGAGYRSPQGEQIPLYTDKRFAFAKDSLFNPSVFQHEMDPGNEDPIELLYGFQSYEASTDTLKYDIEFSVEFEPAVYLITKFVPINGLVYYYFDQGSRRNTDTKITFGSNIKKGEGDSTTVSLLFDRIDDTLGRSGRWMMFDIDLIDFKNLGLGGKFKYEASHNFNVGILVNAPGFSEKIKISSIPTIAEVSWDLGFSFIPGNIVKTEVNGFVDLSMNSNLGGVQVYYPLVDESDPEELFIDVVSVPSTRVSGVAKLHIDPKNFVNQNNYIFAEISQTASSRLGRVSVFLKELENPIFEINNVPSKAVGKIGLHWNRLQGHAYGYTSGGSTMNLNIFYDVFEISNVLHLNAGYLDTSFKIANDGYLGLHSSDKMVSSNELSFSNSNTGDSIYLSIGNVKASDFKANWAFGPSGKIKDLGFQGMIDKLENLNLNIDFQGKTADLSLDWQLGQKGTFAIELDQQNDVSIDFSDFAPQSDIYYFDGGITLSSEIKLDMSWDLKQGTKDSNGNVDPGYFYINENVDSVNIKNFDFTFTYQNKYGVSVLIQNLQFYLKLEWYKGDRLLPYVWLEYGASSTAFHVHLLWTNRDGETRWYYDIQDDI